MKREEHKFIKFEDGEITATFNTISGFLELCICQNNFLFLLDTKSRVEKIINILNEVAKELK